LILDQLPRESKPLETSPEIPEPVLLWGPYLWADGIKGRKIDNVIWKRPDLAKDGTHPSPSGQDIVARLLLQFLENDPTAQPWFTGFTVKTKPGAPSSKP
jgi:hypothetical protein